MGYEERPHNSEARLAHEIWKLIRKCIPVFEEKADTHFGYRDRQELCYEIAREILRRK